MTREEREQAIAYLETSFVAESNTDGGWSTHHNNVIRTAIKALEQQPCDDAIGMSKKNCPICDYPFDVCQCRFTGSAHPDRSKRARVVADHIYLLSDEQVEHLKRVQKWWHIVYADEEMKQILAELEK